MLIIPSIDGTNLNRCNSIIRVLRGFVSLVNVKIQKESLNLTELIRLFNRQNFEVELSLNGTNDSEILTKIVTAHSDVNIGKVLFYNNDENTVEQDITNVRIFGIQPGLIIDQNNYKKISIVNKFEFALIDVYKNPNYMDMYKEIKSNAYKGNLILDFGTTIVPREIFSHPEIDGIYFDITQNPRIKDTISSFRREANTVFMN